MRVTRTPQEGCGTSREKSVHLTMNRAARAFACALAGVLMLGVSIAPASAQDPSIARTSSGKSNSFGTTPGGMFGKINKKIDSTKPMNLQGDQLVYDTAGNRVIARGNVEIFYNDNILTADEVVYDQGAGTLTAVGNVTLKEPQGNIIRADRYTLTDDFRDGFVQSLSVVSKDDTRISADRATRRDGNVTEFQNGRFTPCKSEGGTPPLWCISAARIIHDQEAATISYQDAYFEIFGQ
ncbi:MAG TPA: LptA/OstA family protein, partial [Hyphomicrobium sp.]|nr:LptA/OstA family protein [Hyphomicrobium sp.]